MTRDALRQRGHVLLTMLTACAWCATFYPAGRGHSVTSRVGSAREREPWIAVQRAARESLGKREAEQEAHV